MIIDSMILSSWQRLAEAYIVLQLVVGDLLLGGHKPQAGQVQAPDGVWHGCEGGGDGQGPGRLIRHAHAPAAQLKDQLSDCQLNDGSTLRILQHCSGANVYAQKFNTLLSSLMGPMPIKTLHAPDWPSLC